MRLGTGLELTYCTNIHPANGWSAVLENLRNYGPALKAQLSPEAPFGLGLRLSAAEAAELASEDKLSAFASWLRDEGLYVALVNAFPAGPFHGQPVKAEVFAPDWQSASRLRYTLDCVHILSRVLPEGAEGGVSTIPLSYKRWVSLGGGAGTWDAILSGLVEAVSAMARIRAETGGHIHLDIEPEPDGLVENTAEFVSFFRDHVLRQGVSALAASMSCTAKHAEEVLRNHICVCLDTCHFAVEHENAAQVLGGLHAEGIRVGRLQISSALRVEIPAGPSEREHLRASLAPFADPVYLHQVIGDAERFHDLPDALEALPSARGREWRIHFHVPLFTRDYVDFGSTQDEILPFFDLLRKKPFTRHLEIETYTWSVLPPERKGDLLESILREYRWVLRNL
jgi:hypothetical protein